MDEVVRGSRLTNVDQACMVVGFVGAGIHLVYPTRVRGAGQEGLGLHYMTQGLAFLQPEQRSSASSPVPWTT